MTETLQSPSTNHQPQPTKRGWINTFYRHYKGKRLGPYHVRRWKVGRKLFKEYIKPQDVERVKAECDAYRQARKARQEAGRRETTFVDNFVFLERMVTRLEKGKEVPAAHANWIARLHKDGCYATGRPSMRRRIVKRLGIIDGEWKVVTTIFELDRTKRVFMVPLLTNDYLDRMKQEALAIWHGIHGSKTVDPMMA